jgi:hypothetical protein
MALISQPAQHHASLVPLFDVVVVAGRGGSRRSSAALETVLSPVFGKVAQTFVDRFVARAEQVYGPR